MSIEDAAEHASREAFLLACLWRIGTVLDDPATAPSSIVALSKTLRWIVADLGDLTAARRRAMEGGGA